MTETEPGTTALPVQPERHTAELSGGRSGRRRALVALATAVVLAAAAAAAAAWWPSSGGEPVAAQHLPPATDTVARGDLSSQTRVPGTVDFSGARTIDNQLSGIVTWTPSPKDVVQRGRRLYDVDNLPVILMRGSLPAWRDFKPGMSDGEDVRMLEANLAELGYTGFTVDDEFTEKTEAAVKRWQKDDKLPQTGKIELGRVVFAPGPLRVTRATARPGDRIAPAQAVLEVSGSRQRITATVPTTDQDLAVKGATVRIELTDGTAVQGTVSSVGVPTTKDGKQVVPVTVQPDSAEALRKQQSPDVTVLLTRLLARDVLSVPVTALLPARDGGYAVQLVRNGTVSRVQVKTGMFADGRVEIDGPGITEGARVGVPKL